MTSKEHKKRLIDKIRKVINNFEENFDEDSSMYGDVLDYIESIRKYADEQEEELDG